MNYSVKRIKKVDGEFKIETPQNVWNEDFVCFRSQAYSFNCNDGNTNKLKVISESQSRHIGFEQYKKCLDGKKYQKECDDYILKSINHDMYLQRVCKTTLSIFDNKRNYIKSTKSLPWN